MTTTIGYTVNSETYGYSSSAYSVQAAGIANGYTHTRAALTMQRWYLNEGALSATLPTGLANLIAAGVRAQLCVRPSRSAVVAGGPALASEQSSLASCLGAVKTAYLAAGLPAASFTVTLWTEFNDSSKGFFPYTSGSTTISFAQYWAAYAPTILAAGLDCYYNPAGNATDAVNAINWFPAMSPAPTGLVVDLYCNAWLNGGSLIAPPPGASTSLEALADGAGIKFGMGEFGLASGHPASPPDSGKWSDFGDMIIDVFTTREDAGKPNAEVLFFGSSTTGSTSPIYNSIQSATDFKTGNLAGITGILQIWEAFTGSPGPSGGGLPPDPIPVFPAGYAPQDPDFTTWIQDTFGYLTAGTVFRAHQQVSGGQTLSSGATVLSFDTVDEDPYSGWEAASDAWLAPWTGTYEITVCTSVAAQAVWLGSGLKISGGTVMTGQNLQTPSATVGGSVQTFTVQLTGGVDYIQAVALCSAAAATDTSSAGRYPSMEITYVSS